MRLLALMSLAFAASLLGFGAAGYWTAGWVAASLMALITIVFAAGECLHGTIHVPLSADLAPPRVVGRYLAFASQSWQIGWIIGPACGGFILQHAPFALFPVAAGMQLVAAAWAVGLERDFEAPRRRARREHRQGRLAVASVQRHQQVRLLGLCRHPGRRARALHVDDDHRQL